VPATRAGGGRRLTLLTRWAGLAALAALLGGLAVAVLVLPPDDDGLARRLVSWCRSWIVVLLVTGASELLLRARTMSGGELVAGLAAVPAVLAHTHFGTVLIVRFAALVGLLALIGRRGGAARTLAGGLALALAYTTALVGHAADRGDLSASALVDWLHVTAAAVWTGGLFCLASVVLGEAQRWTRTRLAGSLGRFSTLAGVCLVVVVASGVFNAWERLGALDALWTTTYGAILAVKILLVATVASLGAATRFAVLPRLRADPIPPGRTDLRLGRYVAFEAALALLVFGCTALLTESTPPRHHADMAPASRPS